MIFYKQQNIHKIVCQMITNTALEQCPMTKPTYEYLRSRAITAATAESVDVSVAIAAAR